MKNVRNYSNSEYRIIIMRRRLSSLLGMDLAAGTNLAQMEITSKVARFKALGSRSIGTK